MIAPITTETLRDTHDCAFGFFEESQLPGKLNFPYWMGRWQQIFELDMGTILAYRVENEVKGLIGGVCVPCTMTGDLEVIEAFWWIRPEFRGVNPAGLRLLFAFEKWAVDRKAVRIKMMHLANLNAAFMRSIYLRMGYQPLEQAYWKSLEGLI